MDFSEAEQQRSGLLARYRSGHLTADQYAAAVGNLRVMDAQGFTWQPNPNGDGWLFWTGTAWQAGTLPFMTGQESGQPQKAKDFKEFQSSLMTVDEFRKISKDVPLAKRPQKWWDLLSIMGGIVGAILWFLYGGIRSGREGFDLITPLLMIAIPVILVWFRADIDQMLQPLQPTRKKISKILLIGLGIATPFLTAWILYNIFNIDQYPLMQANIIVGTLAAYAITRDPQAGFLQKQAPGVASALILFTVVLCSCMIAPVLADDCARDPLNAQDCLRTNGYAEGMAGAAASAISVLINGPIIMQTLIQGGSGAGVSVRTAPPVIIPGGGGTATVTGGDGTDPVSKWIATRTTYPGSWILSPDGKSVKMEGLSGYEIPVEWIAGTSENEIENIIFGTEIPVSDHEQLANTITRKIDGTDLETFTRSRWVEMGDEEKKDALTRLAQNLGKQLGESSVTVELDPNMTFGNGEPMDACFTNGTVKINPNSSLWNKPREMIERLAHEVKHQQQGNPNNPMENEAARNAATVNDQNYHTFDSDPVKYSGQYVENDCNSFAQNVRSKLRGKAIAEQEEKLFNFLGELKDAAGKKSNTPTMTLDDIKKDPQGFLDHLEKNPDQKAKFVKILKHNKGM
jgi:hypothetical protein